MRNDRGTRPVRPGLTMALAAALVLGFSGCAPEPADPAGTGDVAGQPTKGKGEGQSESSWGQPTDGAPLPEKSTELPEGFPRDRFPIPVGAQIDDTGERPDAWFLVLRAPDAAAAEAMWNEVIANGGFEVNESSDTPDGGRSASLVGGGLAVLALTIPQDDGTVLLSYDLTLVP